MLLCRVGGNPPFNTNSNIWWVITYPTKHNISLHIMEDSMNKKIKYFVGIYILLTSSLYAQNTVFIDNIVDIWHWLVLLIIIIFHYIYLKIFVINKFTTAIYTRYTPPKDLSILQLGVLYNKFINHKDLSSAIIELAQEGYLTIQKARDRTTLSKIYKDSSKLSDDLKYLLNNILFNNVTSNIKYKKLNDELYKWTYDEGYMATNPQKSRNGFLIRAFFLSITLMVISFFTSIDRVGEEETFLSFISLIFAVGFVYYLFLSKNIIHKLFAIIFLVTSQLIFVELYTKLAFSQLIYTPLLLGFIIAVLSFYTYTQIGIYTMKGAKIKNHLNGFSQFISKITTAEVEKKLKYDPLYLDKYLPYAIMFGHTKYWLSFYTKLDIESPSWYLGELDKISELIDNISYNISDRAYEKIIDRVNEETPDGRFAYHSQSSNDNFFGDGESDGGD